MHSHVAVHVGVARQANDQPRRPTTTRGPQLCVCCHSHTYKHTASAAAAAMAGACHLLILLSLVSHSSAGSVYQVDDGQCGESDVPTAFIGFAIGANPGLQRGTCASVGYTVAHGTTSVSSPLGNIQTRIYLQPASASPPPAAEST
eukprot:COSAG01_NODE_31462_length_597_cov_0.919679_2_plen_145_part_01